MNIYLKKKFLGVLQNMKNNRIPRSENKVKKKLRKKDYYKYQSSTDNDDQFFKIVFVSHKNISLK